MPTSVRESIILNLATLLATITSVNGYSNTIASVQRWKQHGNAFVDVPLIIIQEDSESRKEDTFSLTSCTMTVVLELWHRQDPASNDGTFVILNSLLADITKALKIDITRGGYALDTSVTSVEPFIAGKGEEHAGLFIEVEIEYRHQQSDPAVAG